jgi:serine/threonine protein kinase
MADVLERLKAALADRYTIERELGSGGMATVYLAQDLKHEREVAEKVLRPELAVALGADRFHREIKIASSRHSQDEPAEGACPLGLPLWSCPSDSDLSDRTGQ